MLVDQNRHRGLGIDPLAHHVRREAVVLVDDSDLAAEMMLLHPVRDKLGIHDACDGDHRTRKGKKIRRRLPDAVMGAGDDDRHVRRIQQELDRHGTRTLDVQVLAPVLGGDDIRHAQRFGNVPRQVTPTRLGDSPGLLEVVRHLALEDVLNRDAPPFHEKRPQERGKASSPIISVSLDETELHLNCSLYC